MDEQIKPVAWVDTDDLEYLVADGEVCADLHNSRVGECFAPLYPQQAIDALRAEVREAREFRDKMADAIGNDQLRRFIEKHGEPVPLTTRMQEAEARAERLAEALREAYRQVRELCDCYGHVYPEASFVRYEALLRAQEEGE